MKTMDHDKYPKALKVKSYDTLLYIIKDAAAAIKVYPENLNCGYYQDEINYCCNEINRRKQIV